MYRNVLQSIQDIQIWPEISLILFFIVFVGVLIYVFRLKKPFIEEAKNLPFKEGGESLNSQES